MGVCRNLLSAEVVCVCHRSPCNVVKCSSKGWDCTWFEAFPGWICINSIAHNKFPAVKRASKQRKAFISTLVTAVRRIPWAESMTSAEWRYRVWTLFEQCTYKLFQLSDYRLSTTPIYRALEKSRVIASHLDCTWTCTTLSRPAFHKRNVSRFHWNLLINCSIHWVLRNVFGAAH